MSKLIKFTITSCLIFLLLGPSPSAQSATATLSGTIQDQNGAVLPGTTLTVQNTATAFERHATTNESGQFTVPLLPPGTYTVTARRVGFSVVQVPDVVLNVGDQKAVTIQLKVGQVEGEVIVTPDAPLVNTSPAVATTIDRTFVSNLPLNGRSFQSLILLTPGVTVTTADAGLGGFSVNGQRASTNYFTVDGVSANMGLSPSVSSRDMTSSLSGAYPGTNAFGGTNNLVSVDALEEYKIQTSTYTAELGRQPGGQVSLVTRSGSNQIHGTLFEYLRNEALDARDYFNFKPQPKPALRQNQFGGTFSGPVFLPNIGDGGPSWYNGKDRTFFFFSYEGQRLQVPRSGITFVPSLRVREAAPVAVKPFLNAFPRPTGNETTTATTCVPSTNDTTCAPNGRRYSGKSPYNYGVSSPSTADATSIRIDHTVSSKLALFGRFNESPSEAAALSTADGGAYSNVIKSATRTLTFGATSVFTPRLNNELRFNYSRQRGQQQLLSTSDGGAVPIDSGLLTNGLGGPGGFSITFGGSVSQLRGGEVVGNYQRQLNIVDNLSLILGEHQLKFGVDYRQLSPTFAQNGAQAVTFVNEASLNSAIANQVSISKIESARPTVVNYSLYGQDTWKVTPRLTLDLGLRWELNPPPTEADSKLPVAVIGVTGTDVTGATLAPAGTPFYKTFWTAFAPRFGAAYQLSKKPGHETVLRGGFGVYYDLGNSNALNGFPLRATRSLFGVPFPLSAANAARPTVVVPTSLPVTVNVVSNDENLKLPYTLQWNVAVEQSFGTQQSLSVSYVGSAARRLLTARGLNQAQFLLAGPRANPNFAGIDYATNGPTSDYNSLQAQYRARFKHGLRALVNYTWSHAIDEISDDQAGPTFSRGNADFDIRHNFSAAFTYELPTPKGQILTHLLGGWSIDGIIHAQSGFPINLAGGTASLNGESQNVRPDLVPGQPLYIRDSTVPGGRRFNHAAFTAPPSTLIEVLPGIFFPVTTRQGTFGRNVLRGLPLYQTDLALGRNFKLKENINLRLKGEVFNVFNHPMFGLYGSNYNSPDTFGVPFITLGRSLGGLNQLYQIGGPRSIQVSVRLTW